VNAPAAFLFTAAAFLTVSAPRAGADEIRLKDGTVLLGVIAGVEGGVLSIVPGYNADGSVKVFKFKLDDILTFTTNDAIYVGTASEANATADNVAYGRVEASPSGIRVVTSTGTIAALVSQVKVIYRTPEESPLAKQVKKLERKWAVEVFTDIRGKTGTSEQVGATAGFTAVNSGQNDTLSFAARYNYYRTDKKKSADDLTAGVDYKSNFSDRFFWYARTNTGFNKINLVDFYSESATGLGVMVIKESTHKLEFRLGAAYRYESYISNNPYLSKFALDAGLAYQYAWSWGRFEDKVSFLPTFEELDNYILRHEAFIEFPIASTQNWFIRLGIQNDFNSRPVANVEKLDTTYFTRIVVKF
jgi:hypothetical protein